jgi:cytochrome o ubiquinol oxidase subunit 1
MTGVLLAVPPADFALHNTVFVIAHFHNVIIGGVVFALYAGITFWFPKAFGFKLDEAWGKAVFWFTIIGFYVTFMPLYVAGLLGMTRRLQHYEVAEWRPWVIAATFGIAISGIAMICQFIQLYVSIRDRDALRDKTGDLWNGRSLEWATSSPPPVFNFAFLPEVKSEEPYWEMKQRSVRTGHLADVGAYEPIDMPRNSATGFMTAFFATMAGFSLIWHIWWMVIVSLIAAYAGFVWFAWRDKDEFTVPASEVKKLDQERRLAREAWLAREVNTGEAI